MDLLNLAAKLTLNDDGFKRGVSSAEKTGKGLSDSLQKTFSKIKTFAATALSGAAIKKGIDMMRDLVNEVAAAGDRIDKQSQALGMSRKAFQEWDYILGQNGASIDSLGVSMKTLNSTILSAADGSEEANESLVRLGLNYVELGKMDPEKQFEEVVRAFQKMPAGAQKSALAVKMFGRNGMELLPLLNQADTSIDELRQRAEELGLIMSDDAVDAAVVYGDSLDDLQRTFNSFKYAVGSKILPTLTTGIQKITSYAGKIRKAYDSKGFAGVWDTLVKDFQNIKWPSWSDVEQAIRTAWGTIQSGFEGVAKLAFGTTPDGGIKWPTAVELWQKTSDAFQTLWKGYQTYAGTVMKLVFGETPDGGIEWPTVDSISDKVANGLRTLWEGLKSGSLNEILKITFGENDEGGIAFPSWETIWNIISTPFKAKWTPLAGAMSGVAKFVFGETEDGGIKWPTWTDIWEKVKQPFIDLWDGIKGAAQSVMTLVFGESEDGGLKFASATDVWNKISGAVSTWWNTLKTNLAGVLNYTLGLFGLPPVTDMVTKVSGWWGEVKAKVGNLVFEFKATVAGWFETIKEWLSGTGVKSITIDFAAKVAEWIQTIYDWIKNGINIGVNFLTGGLPEVPASSHESEGGADHGGGNGHSFAKGSRFIPYDMIAQLHRGEEVLTASQARRRRESGNNFGDLGGIVARAIREGMEQANVNTYVTDREVSRGANRWNGQRIEAGRFAT